MADTLIGLLELDFNIETAVRNAVEGGLSDDMIISTVKRALMEKRREMEDSPGLEPEDIHLPSNRAR